MNNLQISLKEGGKVLSKHSLSPHQKLQTFRLELPIALDIFSAPLILFRLSSSMIIIIRIFKGLYGMTLCGMGGA